VRNAWVTYPGVWNNIGKPVLIPHNILKTHVFLIKDLSLWDRPASY
jgi:hypothetical protein